MSTSVIVCAGKNASARHETAISLRGRPSFAVVEAADAISLRTQLQPYRSAEPLRVMLQYSLVPLRTRLLDPEGWWDEMSEAIARSAPEISRAASAKVNINKDTGGGFLQFCWDEISPDELETYCRVSLSYNQKSWMAGV